jgi:hypothetical protein
MLLSWRAWRSWRFALPAAGAEAFIKLTLIGRSPGAGAVDACEKRVPQMSPQSGATLQSLRHLLG